MAILQQIRDEVAKSYGWEDFDAAAEDTRYDGGLSDHFHDIVANKYAQLCCKASLEKAASDLNSDNDRENITHERNIVLL